MSKWIWIIAAAAMLFGYRQWQQEQAPAPEAMLESYVTNSDNKLQTAFEHKQNDVQVEGQGKVLKTLPDDNKGSRHQRFILKLNSGQTLLVAHNIDLSPKIKGLKKGDEVAFFGVYEWSAQGGVIHWTHHDPQGRHIDGWLKHNGRIYQ